MWSIHTVHSQEPRYRFYCYMVCSRKFLVRGNMECQCRFGPDPVFPSKSLRCQSRQVLLFLCSWEKRSKVIGILLRRHYLWLDVSMEDHVIVYVFNSQSNLYKPIKNLSKATLIFRLFRIPHVRETKPHFGNLSLNIDHRHRKIPWQCKSHWILEKIHYKDIVLTLERMTIFNNVRVVQLGKDRYLEKIKQRYTQTSFLDSIISFGFIWNCIS